LIYKNIKKEQPESYSLVLRLYDKYYLDTIYPIALEPDIRIADVFTALNNVIADAGNEIALPLLTETYNIPADELIIFTCSQDSAGRLVNVPVAVAVLEKSTKGADVLLLTSNGPVLPVTLPVEYVYPGSNAIIIVSLI